MDGTIYYRLKLVDKNGSFSYSSIGVLQPVKVQDGLSVSILLNPVSKKRAAVVRLVSYAAQSIVLKVITSGGAVLITKNISVPSGSTNFTLPETATLPAGTYLLQVATGKGREMGSTKLVIQ